MKAVWIIGAGVAGLSAALTLARHGQESVLVSSAPSVRAQSVMAEGGINAALDTKGQGDSMEEHFRDTMEAGCGLADPNAVRALTEGAAEVVRTLARLGVAFNRTEGGALDLRYFGGQKKKRTAFAQSSTGRQVMAALIQEARRWEDRGLIRRKDHHEVVKYLTRGQNECTGCIILDKYTKSCEILSGTGLLASGGLNGLFGRTTGAVQNTGAAAAAAYLAGAACANLEMIQYHPTTAAISGKRALLSEAARGEGGRLFVLRDGSRWYYMEEKYPELKNLMPRDVVSRETEAVCRECGQDTAWLDLTGVDKEVLSERLGDLTEFCREFLHRDPRREPIPVYPGIHYFMGGLYVDAAHRTTLRGLYAAGECACQYHGANRLGGNSLLGAIFGGYTAAQTILRDIPLPEMCAAEAEKAAEDWRALCGAVAARREIVSCAAAEAELSRILNGCLGIRRQEVSLHAGAAALAELTARVRAGWDREAGAARQYALEAQLSLAAAMVESALARKESRGAHFRTDFPRRDDARYQKTTVARWKGGSAEITFEPIAKEAQPCAII